MRKLFPFPHLSPSWLLSRGATAVTSCVSLPQFWRCESDGRGVAKSLKENTSTWSDFLLFKPASVQTPREKFIKNYMCFQLCQNILLLNTWLKQQLTMAGFLSTPTTNWWDYSILVDSPQINSSLGAVFTTWTVLGPPPSSAMGMLASQVKRSPSPQCLPWTGNEIPVLLSTMFTHSMVNWIATHCSCRAASWI